VAQIFHAKILIPKFDLLFTCFIVSNAYLFYISFAGLGLGLGLERTGSLYCHLNTDITNTSDSNREDVGVPGAKTNDLTVCSWDSTVVGHHWYVLAVT